MNSDNARPSISRRLRIPALAALVSCALFANSRASAQAGEPRDAQFVRCTTDSVSVDGGPATQQKNPIAYALRRAAPGALIELAAGDYPHFGIGFNNPWEASNAPTPGGTAAAPIVVRGGAGVRVVPSGSGDTIAICQQVACGYIRFEDLSIVPGTRAGVIFYRSEPGQVHRGFAFHDCDILGEYDHAAASGPASKWGVSAHQIADFEWKGVRRPSRIENIKDEHAFYLQNTLGDVTIENVEAKRIGRTFLQLVARSNEGPAAAGTVSVKRCKIDDACIAAGDAYKGGSALTIAGTGEGCTVVFEDNVVRAGFESALHKLTLPGQPYGSGACVVWDGGDARGNGSVIVKRNQFVFAPGCGDRPLASFAACRELLLDANQFKPGGNAAALALDPHDDGGRPKSKPNGRVVLGATNVLGGPLEVRGVITRDDPAAALSKAAAQR
jgi:hypothetical protein